MERGRAAASAVGTERTASAENTAPNTKGRLKNLPFVLGERPKKILTSKIRDWLVWPAGCSYR